MPTITNTLPAKPEVKIIVDGLFVLCMNDTTSVATLGVYEHSVEHRLAIRISEKEYGSLDASTFGRGGDLVRYLDDQDEIENGDISITVPSRASDIKTYHHPHLNDVDFTTDPRDLSSKIATNRREFKPDFRWIIDLEGTRFHNKKLPLVSQVINRKIHIDQGVFYTENFTGRKIKQAYEATAINMGMAVSDQFYYVATQMAIAIEAPKANETLVISYGENNNRQTIVLPAPGANSYYEIYTSNNCSLSDADIRRRLYDKKPRHSDFQNYYNLIDLPVAERRDLWILKGEGSPNFPCDMTRLGQHSDLP